MILYLAHAYEIKHTSSGRHQPHTTSSTPSLCGDHRSRRTRDETKRSRPREQSPARSHCASTVQDPSCCHPPQRLFSPFMVLPLKAITAQSYSQGSPMNASKPSSTQTHLQLKATTLPLAFLGCTGVNHGELGCLENKSPTQRIPARLERQPRVLIQSQTQ